jgi:hypothetical protein
VRCFLFLLFLTQHSTFNPQPLQAATFTTNLTLTETNFTYDGQDILIDGATVAIDGPHAFNSLLLTNGAVLTHSPCTATETHKLDLTVTNALVVSTNSRIDVSGKGYVAGRTTGNSTNAAATGFGGGTYGGSGSIGAWGGTPNSPYGYYIAPEDWGSGSGLGQGGVAGGGLVRIRTTTILLDGQILADGGTDSGTVRGGGSGGGILVVAEEAIAGNGTIRAGGGNASCCGFSGAGGGGRVALYARDLSEFSGAQKVTAPGGMSSGGAGTVYLRDLDEAYGMLVIAGANGGNGFTPLGLPGENHLAIPDVVVVSGANSRLRTEHASLMLDFQNNIIITNGGSLAVEGDWHLSVATALRLADGGQLIVSGSLTAELATPLIAGGYLTVIGAYMSSVPVTVEGGTLTVDRIVAPGLTVTNGGVLTCPASTATEMHKLEVEVVGTVSVSTNSRIDVSGKGYVAGRTSLDSHARGSG